MRIIKTVIMAGVLGFTIMDSFAQTVWTLRSPYRNLKDLYAVTWTGNQLVAVGGGPIIISPDGINWDSASSEASLILWSVVQAGNQLVAVGHDNLNTNGLIMRSQDGISWVKQNTSWDLLSVAWNGSLIVAVGEEGSVLTSSDGINWTTRFSESWTRFTSITWTGSQWVAVGRGTDTTGSGAGGSNTMFGRILTSLNGINWTARTSGAEYGMTSVVWTGNQLVSVGDGVDSSTGANYGFCQTSTDGISWTIRKGISTGIQSVAWMGNKLVGVGFSGVILTSANGINWTQQNSGTIGNLWSVTWTGTQLVTVGESGITLTSPDGVNWETQNSGGPRTLTSAVWADSQWVIVGFETRFGLVLTSSNCSTWTSHILGSVGGLRSVIWTGSLLVSVGDSGAIVTSPDGVIWTRQNSGTTALLHSVVWTGNEYVTVGASGIILTSQNAINWSSQVSGTSQNLYSIAWSGSILVVVGGVGSTSTAPSVTLTSSDGVAWTSQSSGGNVLNSVTFANNEFVAVGASFFRDTRFGFWFEADVISTSTNGVIWTTNTNPYVNLGAPTSHNAVTWTGTQSVTVGNGGKISTSSDGVAWINRNSGVVQILNHVTSADVSGGSGSRLILAVERDGVILTSPEDSPTPIFSRKPVYTQVSLRLTNLQLFVTIPKSLHANNFDLSIYTLSGGKLLKSRAAHSGNEMAMPITGLGKGTYLLEARSGNNRIARHFSIVR